MCNILRRNRGGHQKVQKRGSSYPCPPPPPPPPPSTRDKVGCSQPKIPRPGRPPSQVLCNFKVSNSLISHVNLWFQIQYNFAVTWQNFFMKFAFFSYFCMSKNTDTKYWYRHVRLLHTTRQKQAKRRYSKISQAYGHPKIAKIPTTQNFNRGRMGREFLTLRFRFPGSHVWNANARAILTSALRLVSHMCLLAFVFGLSFTGVFARVLRLRYSSSRVQVL